MMMMVKWAQVLEPNEDVIRQVVRDSAQRKAPL